MNILHKIFSHTPKISSPLGLAWMADLCKIDDISAIELATKKLANDFKNNSLQDMQNLEALFSIDEKTHSIVERTTQHFIDIENIDEDIKMRVSNVVFLYHRQLLLIYLKLSEQCELQRQRQLHIFLARALRNATQLIKWRYYNYQTTPANFWLQISSLFKIAEKFSLLNAKIQAYSDQEPISLSCAYIQACMLGSLECISFKPQQIEFISRLLTTGVSKTPVEADYDAERHLFYIDTATNSAAKRIKNVKITNTFRYWSWEEINSKIELCMLLIEYNIQPKQPYMKELISNKYAIETLETLQTEWSCMGDSVNLKTALTT